MKRGLILGASIGLALVLGILISRSAPSVLQIRILSGPGGEGPFRIKGSGDYLGYDEAALKSRLTDFGWRPDPAR